jgi:hypothetical protein
MGMDPTRPATSKTGERRVRAGIAAPETLVEEATTALWTLLDDAYGKAAARAAQVDGTQCAKNVLTPTERRFERLVTDVEPRGIAVSLLLSSIDRRIHGGAFITTSRPYVSLFVAPVGKRGRPHWRIGTTGKELTAGIVDDLFLSVFDDQEDATERLAPLMTYSLG